jgi:hypothetical protein
MNAFFCLQGIRMWFPLTDAFCMNTTSTLGIADQCRRTTLSGFTLEIAVVLH